MNGHLNDLEDEGHVNCGTGSVVYEMLVSWFLQDSSDKPPEYFQGAVLFRKVVS